jgi:hypothetical protein
MLNPATRPVTTGDHLDTSHILSKSTFLRGVGCKKSLFLDTFHHELRDPLPESAQRLMMQGQQVGELAREVFPGGILARQGGPFDFAGAGWTRLAAL